MHELAYLAQQGLNTIQIALFYALIAVAYVLFHGVTGRFNLAFGALAGWAGYLTLAVLASGLERRGVPLPLLAGGAVVAGMTGATLYGQLVAVSVRPLVTRAPLAVLVATLGFAIALEEAMRLSAGSRDLWMAPVFGHTLARATVAGSTLRLTVLQGAVWATACLALAAVLLAVARTSFGRQWRAVAQDRQMAALLGIDVGGVYSATAAAAGCLAGLGGGLAALAYGNATFSGGLLLATKGLFVAILGGLHSPAGAVAGAVLLAVGESLWSAYLPGDYRDVAVIAVLALLVASRPRREDMRV